MKRSKDECRKKLRESILLISTSQKKSKSNEINKLLKKLLLQKKYFHKIIGGYYPLQHEANYLDDKDDFPNAFAVMTVDETLIFKLAKARDLVSKKAYGQIFMEPDEQAKEVVPEVLIIPGLGFSKRGERIGKGKGYYDKYLNNKNVVKIGICFHEQLVDEIPTDLNDSLMDFIVTDKVLLEIK